MATVPSSHVPPAVRARWLAANLDAVVVCDVRWYLDDRSALDIYRAGHLPGAVFIDLDRCLAGPPSRAAGRHPLPSPQRFAECMSRAGIADGAIVVAYDDTGGSTAARLVWMLRALGEHAALLDGGIAAWRGALETGDVGPRSATFTPRPWPADRLAAAVDVAQAKLVLDARVAERYRGDVEPIDARPGHVPGARNAPWTANLSPDLRLRSAADLRSHYRALGATPAAAPVVYCGSGVTACLDLLALELAGFGRARLYDGSWSQWSADPLRPAVLGDGP